MISLKIAPDAAAIKMGINATTEISLISTSTANKTPAMGALKVAAIPAATPQATIIVLSSCVTL